MCNSYKCNTHNDKIKSYCNYIISSIMASSDACLPKTMKSKKILGWNEFVQPFLDKSLLWHDIWIQNGRPRGGLIANIMRAASVKRVIDQSIF